MMHILKNKTRALLALILVIGFVMTGSASAASPVIELCALPGSLAPLPMTNSGLTIPVWGFGIPSSPGNCNTAVASVPGPQLVMTVGDTVTIHLANALPVGHEVSLEIPGMGLDPGLTNAAPGTSVTITFTASAAGTYLYQSGGDAGRQEAMGLYGMLIVRPVTAGQAYNAATAYDVEAPLVLSAVDPDFNANPDSYDMYTYRATYWLINGRAYPDTAPITAVAGQRVLLRYANAGFDNTAMAILGMHEQVVAKDARLLNNPFLANAEVIPAGATEDAIATVPAGSAPGANGFAVYNRQLHVTNGLPANANFAPGGMLTFIRP